MPSNKGEGSPLSVIHINVPRALKARWVKQSQASGQKLTDWIIISLEPYMPKIIEQTIVEGLYGLNCEVFIVESANHGRLLVSQGFGGGDVEGQTYRWRHGTVAQLKAATAFADLFEPWNDDTQTLSAVLRGYDETQPVLNWSGHQIDALVESLQPPPLDR